MTEPKMILRWLSRAAILQSTLIFLVDLLLTKRLSMVSSSVTEMLYTSNVSTEQVDRVSQVFSSISSLTLWIFLAGITATCVGYGLLRSVIIKSWPKPTL